MKKTILILLLCLISSPVHAEEIWSEIDDSGNIINNTVCTADVCGENGSWGGVMPGTNHKMVLQTKSTPENPQVGGYWGTYNNETQTFTIDRSCSSCEIWKTVTPGTIKDNVFTEPQFIFDELSNKQDISLQEAKDLIQATITVVNENRVKFSKNIKSFKAKSITPKICKVNRNTLLIIKSGMCKISITSKGKTKIIKQKVTV